MMDFAPSVVLRPVPRPRVHASSCKLHVFTYILPDVYEVEIEVVCSLISANGKAFEPKEPRQHLCVVPSARGFPWLRLSLFLYVRGFSSVGL